MVTGVLAALLVVVSVALAVTVWLLVRRRVTPPKGGSEALAARYHELIDGLPATVAVWNTETMSISFVSSQVEQLTGEPAAMWLGEEGMLRFRSRVHPDDLADPDRWRSNDDLRPSQFRWKRSDGRTIWIRESQSPVSGRDMLGFLSDVTAEVVAVADLAEQRQRYQTLIEQLPVVTFLIGAPDGTLLYVSPQVESMLGVSVEQALDQGRTPEGRRSWFHPDDYDGGLAEAREMYEGRADEYMFQGRMLHADGSVRHVKVIGRALKDDSGTIVASQVGVIDVTDEVNARAERDAHLLRYQTLIEQLPVVTFLVGADGTLLYVSPQIESIGGMSVERALEEGRTAEGRRSWFHPDDYDRGLAQAREMYEGRADGYTFEGREFRGDGSLRHVRMIVRALKDETGAVVAGQGVTIDVTDEVNARAERDAHLLRYQNLIEQLPVATYIFDTDGRVVYVSPQIEQILGITVEQAMTRGQTPESRRPWFHPDDREWTLAFGREVYEGRSDGHNIAARMIHADGSTRHVRLIARTLKGANGELVGVQGIVIDVTDEVNARAERDAHLLRYQTLIEQTPVLTYVTDDLGVTTYVSPQCEQLLGYTQDELEGMDELERRSLIFHPDDQSRMAEQQEALLTGQVDSADEAVRMVARDGSLRYVQIVARRISGADGAVLGTQGVVVNLTELRAAEQRSSEVLGALVTAAEDERARIATELHDDTVQVMTALLMHVRMLMRKDAGLEHFEQLLSEALDRTRRLMFELRPHVLERSGLGAAIDELAGDGPWQRAEVRIEVPRQSDTLEAVAYRAIRELIVNARKHSQASLLSITGWRDEGELHFVVEDDGVGFDVARALDRDRMRMHIGLDATAERVNLAGGSLRIDSAPGDGARFSLMLPEQPREAAVPVPNGSGDTV